jgi:F-type H+-transporting ATPase subunit b
VEILAAVAGPLGQAAPLAQGEGNGLVINWFWIVVSSLNFLFFLFLLTRIGIGPVQRVLDERRARIEQGLKDAEEARKQRERSEEEHRAALAQARQEAADIITRAQKVADESAAQLIATARQESDRIVDRGRAEVGAEKDRAIAEIRSEVADLAIRAAEKVVGESLDGERQRALVQQFLAEAGSNGEAAGKQRERR